MRISPRTTDAEMLEALKKGGRPAEKCLRYLYQSQLKGAVAHVVRNSGSEKDGEDMFQDSLIELYNQVRNDRFRGESSLRTYLMSILKKKWLNVIKRRQVHRKATDQLSEAEERSLSREKAIRAAAKELLSKAGEDCQRLLSLVFYYGYSMEEAAQFVGLKNAQNARNKKRRCVKKIRTWLEAEPHLADLFKVYV